MIENTFDLQRYRKGKKTFWVYVFFTLIYWFMESFFSTEIVGGEVIVESILLFFMYKGFMWIWYYYAARTIYVFIRTVIFLVIFITQFYWMIYAYPPYTMVNIVLEIVIEVITFIILIIKKDLKYFVKIKQLKRKGELSPQILGEIMNEKK